MSKKLYITESQFNLLTNLLTEKMSNSEINKRTKNINHNPTEKQANAGNYRMAHISFGGFKITIENAKGSKRYWKDDKGNEKFNVLKNHYGYFSNSIGHDGDHIDVFLGTNQDSDNVYVVDQNKKDGTFDESKVMLGFDSKKEAKDAYMSNFSPDWKGFKAITGVSKSFFKKWLYDGRKQQKPFAEYVEVNKKKINEQQENQEEEEELILTGEPTETEKKQRAKQEKQKLAAQKRAETRKRKAEEKKREEERQFIQYCRDNFGYRDLFDGDFS